VKVYKKSDRIKKAAVRTNGSFFCALETARNLKRKDDCLKTALIKKPADVIGGLTP
jgi:hypothetical protein